MQSPNTQWAQLVVIALLAMMSMGGTIALLLLGRDVPTFLVGFDGVIMTAAFGHGGFLALSNMGSTAMGTLMSAIDRQHILMTMIMGKPNVPIGKVEAPPMTTGGIGADVENSN